MPASCTYLHSRHDTHSDFDKLSLRACHRASAEHDYHQVVTNFLKSRSLQATCNGNPQANQRAKRPNHGSELVGGNSQFAKNLSITYAKLE